MKEMNGKLMGKFFLVFLVLFMSIFSVFSISLASALEVRECNLWCKISSLFTGEMPVSGEIIGAITGGEINLDSGDCGAVLDQEGETYILTEDMSCNIAVSLIIGANNIILDCQGHKITNGGSTSFGIRNPMNNTMTGYNNVTIKNCDIKGANHGAAIWLQSCSYNTIDNVSISNMWEGLRVGSGLVSERVRYSSFTNLIINNCNVNGAIGIQYKSDYNLLENISINTGWIRGDGAENNDFRNIRITNSGASGIDMTRSSYNEFININTSSNGNHGISIRQNSNNNNISLSTITENSEYGIYIESSSTGNKILNNNLYGNILKQLDFQTCPAPGTDLATLFGGGNYWGHDDGFHDEDTNCQSIGLADSEAYTCLNEWEEGCLPPAPSVQCGDTILEDTVLTEDMLNCPDYGLNIGANNVVLDCAGHTISVLPNANYSIGLTGISGATIKNCIASGGSDGIYLYGSSNNLIINSNASGSQDGEMWGVHIEKWGGRGIHFVSSSGNRIINSSARGLATPAIAIWLESSSNNQIINSSADCFGDYSTAVYFDSSNNNSIINSVIGSMGTRLSIGIEFHGSDNNQVINLEEYSLSLGIAIRDSSNNNLIINSSGSSSNAEGIDIRASSNNTIINSKALGSIQHGIYLEGASNNQIIDSTASGGQIGIHLEGSPNNQIINSNASGGIDGILLQSSSNNMIKDSTITSDGNGIEISSSSNNTLKNMTIDAGGDGIHYFSIDNVNNTIENSRITGDLVGVNLGGENNIIKNSIVAGDLTAILERSGGNYIFNNSLNGFLTCESNNGCVFEKNTILNGGISLIGSIGGAVVQDNNITSTGNYAAIILNVGASYANLTGNIINSAGDGIELDNNADSCDYNLIKDNIITSAGKGIDMMYGSYNQIINNVITSGDYGVYLDMLGTLPPSGPFLSENNSLRLNTITNNEIGVYIGNATNTKIYYNNIYGNTIKQIYFSQCPDVMTDLAALFGGGNFWGRATPPYFVSTIDTNCLDLNDTLVYHDLIIDIPVCGNNIKESGEQCDGSDLNGKSCSMIPRFEGELACDAECNFDISDCHRGAAQDTDGDTIEDASDNCPDIPNFGQENIDGDIFGDLCDICPSDETDSCDTDYTAAMTLTSAGGTLSNYNNEIILEFPANAVTEDISISLTKTTSGPNFIISTLWGEIYEAFYQYVIGPKNYQFNDYYTLKMKYDPELLNQGYSPYDFTMFWFNEETQGWEDQAANGAYCPDSGPDYGYCLVQLNHFSKFAVGLKKIPSQAIGHVITSPDTDVEVQTGFNVDNSSGGFQLVVDTPNGIICDEYVLNPVISNAHVAFNTQMPGKTIISVLADINQPIPADTGGLITLTCHVSSLADGVYPLDISDAVISNENGDNVFSIKSGGEVIVDTTAPVITLTTSTDGWTNDNMFAYLNCEDATTECVSVQYGLSSTEDCDANIDYTGSIAVNGPSYLCWTAIDSAENSVSGMQLIENFDSIAPETSDDAPTGWQTSDVTVTLSATDSESGIMATVYCINGVCKRYENPIEFIEQGLYTLKYYSIDNAGNIETEKSAIILIDKEAPEIFIEESGTMGENNWFVSIVDWIIRSYDSVSGIKSLNYTITKIP